MTTRDGFEPVTDVTADDRDRVAILRAGTRSNSRHSVSRNADSVIPRVPLATMTRRELLVFENDQLATSLLGGLADAAEGNIRALDWITDASDVS